MDSGYEIRSMKIALIQNPVSGGTNGRKMLPRLERKLQARGIRYDLFQSRYNGHLFELARQLAVEDYDAIASMGGDGTNYQILNGLLAGQASENLPPLAILPVGSGNSFAMDLDIFTLDQAVEAIHRNQPTEVDLISYTQKDRVRYFVNLTGLGFVTDVAATAARFKGLGDLSYLVGIFHRLSSLKFHHLDIIIDGERIKKKNCFVEICNSKFTGGSMCMAPHAEIDDGFMDVILVDPMSRLQLISALPKIYKGSHVDLPQVHRFKAREVSISTSPAKGLLPDGELCGVTPSTFTLIPGGLRYLK
ncbi:MAG: diacylglycerol kinase family lipid kinase, partial [Desulfobacterales bacterium]|nr:diacylglycerol kinase family lipid kinase [Desulfobacterales bacterium]